MYYKKIIYLDYMESGAKVKNAGHVKLLLRQDVMTLDIHIKGLYETDTLMAELVGLTVRREAVLGRLCIDKGSCYYNGVYPAGNIDGSGLGAQELCGIRIRLSDTRCVEAFWQEETEETEGLEGSIVPGTFREKEEPPVQIPQMPAEAVRQEPPYREPGEWSWRRPKQPAKRETEPGPVPAERNAEGKAAEKGGEKKQKECRRESGNVTASAAGAVNYAKGMAIQHRAAGNEPEAFRMPDHAADGGGRQNIPGLCEEASPFEVEKLYEDKWSQLCHTYQVVHPFGEEAYIRLTPKDFVILRQEYQQLVNNSFLLHGYYNYRHLILGKVKGDPEGSYYLGVPGTYYEREKMVAVMFGFEGFESADENIDSGTFGYYMRKVQI